MGTFPAFDSDQDFGNYQGISTMSTIQGDCDTYYIEALDCENVAVSGFYLKLEFNKVEHEKDISLEKNGDGKVIFNRVVTRPKFSFNYLSTELDDWYFENAIAAAKSIELTKIGGTTWPIQILSIEPVIGDEIPVVQKRVSFYADLFPAVVGGSCCGTVFGDDELEIREEGTDPCSGISVGADIADDTITLEVTGAVVISSQWSLNGVSVGTNISSLEMEGYGDYQISVIADGCSRTLTYTRLNPCAGFTITKEVLGNAINISVDDEHLDALFTWEFSEDGEIWELLTEDTSSHVAEEDGYYRVTATDGDCTQTIIIPIGVAGCIIDGELAKEGNVLTFDSEVEDLTFEWFFRGDGVVDPVLIDGETSNTYTALENGLYIVEVTLDGCTQTFDIVHSVCTACGAFGASVDVAGDTITATVEGCGEAEYNWYQQVGGIKEDTGETSNVYELPEDGLYFLVICCADCDPKVFIITKAGATITISDNSLPSGGTFWKM